MNFCDVRFNMSTRQWNALLYEYWVMRFEYLLILILKKTETLSTQLNTHTQLTWKTKKIKYSNRYSYSINLKNVYSTQYLCLILILRWLEKNSILIYNYLIEYEYIELSTWFFIFLSINIELSTHFSCFFEYKYE